MPTKKRKKSVLNAIDRYLLQKKYSIEKEDKITENAMRVVPKVLKEMVPIVMRKGAKIRPSVKSAKNRKSEPKILTSKVEARKTVKKDIKNSTFRKKKSLNVELPNSRKSVKSEIPKTSPKTPKIKLLSSKILTRGKRGPVTQSKSYERANIEIELSRVERFREGKIRKNAKDLRKTAQITKASSSSNDESSGGNKIMVKKLGKLSRTTKRAANSQASNKKLTINSSGKNQIMKKKPVKLSKTVNRVLKKQSSSKNHENTLTGLNKTTSKRRGRRTTITKAVPEKLSSTENLENARTGENQITTQESKKPFRSRIRVPSQKFRGGDYVTEKKSEEVCRTTKRISKKKSNTENFENNSMGGNQISKKQPRTFIKTPKGVSEKQSSTQSIENNLGNQITRKQLGKLSRTTKSVSKKQSSTQSIENNSENQITRKQLGKLSRTTKGVLEKQSSTESIENDSAGSKKITSERTSSPVPKKKQKVVNEKTDVAETCSSIVENEPCSTQDEVVPSSRDFNADTEMSEEMTKIIKKYQPYMERLKSLSSDDIKKYIQDHQQYYVDYKKQIETKTEIAITPGKKPRKYDEMRESFKCNPFNSGQQLAMYYTFRELFDVPKTHFLECRNFFTALLPEVACQLFAETFHVKVSFAPRLIKKLYPNPVCPV